MGELRSLIPYFRPYRWGLVLGLICVLLANAFQTAGPWLIGLGIDGLESPDVTEGRIAFLASMIVLTALAGGVFRYGMRELLNGISRKIETDLRNDFFAHLLRMDATFFGDIRTGDLMSRATNDTLAVRMAAGQAIMYTVNTAASFVFALALMIWISWRLTLYAMIPMVILPVIVLGFGMWIALVSWAALQAAEFPRTLNYLGAIVGVHTIECQGHIDPFQGYAFVVRIPAQRNRGAGRKTADQNLVGVGAAVRTACRRRFIRQPVELPCGDRGFHSAAHLRRNRSHRNPLFALCSTISKILQLPSFGSV